MTEFSYSDMEALFQKGPAAHFESTILRSAFQQCVVGEQFAHQAIVYRASTTKTIEGEKELSFESTFDAVRGQREYCIKILESQRDALGQVPLEMRQRLFELAKQRVLTESNDGDPQEILEEDPWWQELTDANNLDHIAYLVETGWEFTIVGGEAEKRFIARSFLGAELMYDEDTESADDYLAKESGAMSDEDSVLSELQDSSSALESDDYQVIIDVLERMGLVTKKAKNRYVRGLETS